MSDLKRIKNALISVYDKNGLEGIVSRLTGLEVGLVSTGGTKKHIEALGAGVTAVEDLTSYPSILGGRVKTLHPRIFGGILYRRDSSEDRSQLKEYDLQGIDLVIVDLYPFEKTVASGAGRSEVIEKIDIGGIALIRAAAKNHRDVVVISSKEQYQELEEILEQGGGETSLPQREHFAREAFRISSGYDRAIYNYFSNGQGNRFDMNLSDGRQLRYGENPHQKGFYYGDLDRLFTKISGKDISYNNLLDIDAALNLMNEFEEPTFAVMKHNNACGLASRDDITVAWKDALAGDPLSAFGGVLICNRPIGGETAAEINKIFFEVIMAPEFTTEALDILQQKKNRIILQLKGFSPPDSQFRSILNGVVVQDRDASMEGTGQLKTATENQPTRQEVTDMIFANKLVKHSKSNTIVLAKNKQLCASGVGQTSRVDALKHAIEKANHFGLELKGAVMASDAFFPFSDSVEIASKAGISAVIQPGGSVRDKDSIDFCNKAGMSMVFTGIRHFKH